MTQVDQSWDLFNHQFFNATGEDHFLESKANAVLLQVQKAPQCPTATPSIIAKGPQQEYYFDSSFSEPRFVLVPRAGLGKLWSASNANKPASSWPLKQDPKSGQNMAATKGPWQFPGVGLKDVVSAASNFSAQILALPDFSVDSVVSRAGEMNSIRCAI